jgi:hypothetical protein
MDTMYVRTVTTSTKSGPVKYLQLCRNVHDPVRKRSKTIVVHSFGRLEDLDEAAIRRLIASLARLVPADGQGQLLAENNDVAFLNSRDLGGAWLLDRLWRKLGLHTTLAKLLGERHYQSPVERMLFAMSAGRALEPGSKLSLEHWVGEVVHIPALPAFDVHQGYRAMDFLLEAKEAIQREVFFSVATLFNLEVDLIFLDTTTTYFEVEGEDEGEEALRKRGYSKDNHPELAQVVIGFAVTRDGIPVRSWVWPGNTSDQQVIEEVKRDLNSWQLARVVMVSDAGFNSESNRRILRGAGGSYIIGEKPRLGPKGSPHPAFSQSGPYRTLESGLKIKEVALEESDGTESRRFVVLLNPEEAERDREKREEILREAERRLEELSLYVDEYHTKHACALRSHHVYGRYIRQTEKGTLVIDREKVRREESLDGKHLVSSSDRRLSAEEIALGYKQLSDVERVFRDMKHLIDIRPVFHRLPERITAHITLCWLSMLLIRVAERETGLTWFQMKKVLSGITVGTMQFPDGTVSQSSPLTKEHAALFAALGVDCPPRLIDLSPSSKA